MMKKIASTIISIRLKKQEENIRKDMWARCPISSEDVKQYIYRLEKAKDMNNILRWEDMINYYDASIPNIEDIQELRTYVDTSPEDLEEAPRAFDNGYFPNNPWMKPTSIEYSGDTKVRNYNKSYGTKYSETSAINQGKELVAKLLDINTDKVHITIK